MASSSSSILVSFIILTSYFALNCYSQQQGQGNINGLRIGRKEMRYGHEQGQGQGRRQAQEMGLDQMMGLLHGLNQDQGSGQMQGPGQTQGPGLGQGQQQGQGLGQGPRQGQLQGPELGQGQTQGPRQGQGQTQGPRLGQGQTQGLKQGQGQGQGQTQGPGLGQGTGLVQGQGQSQGQGLGQGQTQGPGPWQGQTQGQGQSQGQGLGQGQSQGSRHGQGQTQGPRQGQGLGQGKTQGSGLEQGSRQDQGLGQGQTQGPGLGQGPRQGQGQGQSQGQGLGQGQTQGPGQGQGQTKGPGLGQGQTQGPGQGKGQAWVPGQGQNNMTGFGIGNKNNTKKTKIYGMFVFGSSLVDNGNNIFLKTLVKPKYLPYGVDFPGGPTGRFTNGKTVIDVFSEYLKLPLIPPFHHPLTKGNKTRHGVNFATGGSGILDLTGAITGQLTWLTKQMNNFEFTILPALNDAIDGEYESEFLPKYIVVIGVGGNDYTMNYFLTPSKIRNLESFTSKLINKLATQIKRLYYLGNRRFVLMGLYPLGCYPCNRNDTNCNDDKNKAAILFNFQLRALIDNLKPQMPRALMTFVDTFNIVMDLIKNPLAHGFKNEKSSCCEMKPLLGGLGGETSLCKKDGHICKNRTEFIFFDGVHPTQAVNMIIGKKAFYSNLLSEVYPMNISKLASQEIDY